MTHHHSHPVAVVGMSAIMPDAPSSDAFWQNITAGRYSISTTPDDRWDKGLYYDENHSVPDKTYSTIGGWVREFDWNPMAWRLPVPPMVAAQMDEGQRWAISAARAALTDAGWPAWPVDSDRVAVILGNALGGEKHYDSSMRIRFPEMLRRLEESATLATLTPDTRERILEETRRGYLDNVFSITEDTMPGELANVIAGRVANLYNLRGMNFTTDAACASGLAALNAAVSGLADHQFDAVVTGGLDRNMGVDAFVKFCKIGALSATGTRPFDAGADGFVMGEGAALFVLKRLEDAERDGDRVYAVVIGIGGSSDGKGKGITAPNPVGQQLAIERAWERAGVDPSTAGAVEAHGTSTRVGDASELTSLTAVFGAAGAAPHSIALGSVKSNIGHLKAAAGAAGLFKMVRSLHAKQLPPSLNFREPNPNVDWDTLPFAVNTGLRPWEQPANDVRRGGVSAFGFGGTNFHVVVEEHVPGRHRPPARSFASAEVPGSASAPATAPTTADPASGAKAPLRGALVLGGRDDADLAAQVQAALARARAGVVPDRTAPDPALAAAAVRIAVDHSDAADLTTKLTKLANAFASGNPAAFRMLRQQGIFVGRGPAPKVAFLYTGQGSQYVNMLKALAAEEPLVTATFDEADAVMTPLLGRPLTSYIFIDGDDAAAVKTLNSQLMQTEITQPAVLAVDIALTRLLEAYGVSPDMVMGHSLGEYGALVAAGALTLPSALEAVSARGREMTKVSMADNGAMAAVFAPMADISRIVDSADGYVVIANINSTSQAVVGGATDAVERIVERFTAEGFTATRIPVSHAFHTSIVAPASGPFVEALRRLELKAPTKPVVANVTGEFYPAGATAETVLEYAGRQIASPVQFVKGLQTLYAAGARVFVEVGPKKALHGFVEDVLGSEHDDVVALFTNHPKVADDVAFNQALCGLYAAGVGLDRSSAALPREDEDDHHVSSTGNGTGIRSASMTSGGQRPQASSGADDDTIRELGLLFADVLEKGMRVYGGTGVAQPRPSAPPAPSPQPAVARPAPLPALEPVVVTGAALGLPGTEQTFADDNVARILAGQNFISVLGEDTRQRMADMRITRLVKDATSGAGSFATIDDPADVIKLAGVHAPLDVVAQYGVDKARDEALDTTTRLAIGVGFDALRDAGIPLVMSYKTTTLGTQLPDRWGLPEALRDETGVIFASAFPGYDRFAEAVEGYARDRGRREGLLAVEGVRARMTDGDPARAEVDTVIAELRETLEREPYQFDRRFLFRALSMGHSQFAEIIGARGPNTQVNAACASTTQALSLAEDWIRAGRCRRVVVVSADDATGTHLMPWVTAGFLASGAAATDERVEDAATPFDRRRHGMVIGAGAAAFVVESAEAARERGLQPIAEALATVTANSAFHGSRLDVQHICDVMEALVREAEGRGVDRRAIAPHLMFMSHETYTPARGGSAAAEINALRRVFGPAADSIVITNTKGFTGHAMGAGIEDVVALKALETGIVPPVPNYREQDPDLGNLNLSTGGDYPVRYALRLAAGFGSQVAMSLLRWTPVPDGLRRRPDQLGYAYRVVDSAAWQRWLDRLAGRAESRLEVDHRRLRVVDMGPATIPVERSGHVPVPYADRLTPTAGFAAPAPAPATTTAAPTPSAPSPASPVPPPAPVVPQAVAPEPAEPSAPTGDAVLAVVTDIVAEMTGYPADLLDPDLDLEADLGVDTVKQAEVFAAVREHWSLERDDDLRLRDFPTLNHVAGWVQGRLGVAAVGSPASASPVLATTPRPFDDGTPAADPVLATVTQIVAEMTGYPADLLGADLDLEADLGVDTVKQAEVFAAVRTQWDLERDDNLQLREFPTLNHVAAWVRRRLGMVAPVDAAPSSAPAHPAPTPAPDAAPAPATPPPAPAAPAVDEILEAVTGIVAEMTGYPADLLDPDLDLEADLGVDTVKQAEVFAAVRTRWNLERDDTLQLREFPTLNHVAAWVRDKLGAEQPTAATVSAAAPDPTPATAAPTTAVFAAAADDAADADADADEIVAAVTEIVAEMTGYPADLLDPDLDLEADLGVDTVKQAEVFAAVRTRWNLERDDTLQLREFPTLNHVAAWVRDKLGAEQPTAATASDSVSDTAPAPAPDVAAPTAADDADEVVAAVTGIVAEMTGYPADLLDPDLDLEADLGVDTVKQAEVFAAVRTRWNLERDDTLQLREFPTLNHVAAWVRDKLGANGSGAAPGPAGESTTAAPVAAPHTVVGDLDAVDALPRRLPTPSLRTSAEQCLPTGVSLQDARVVVMRDEGGVGDALVKRLRKAGATALVLDPGTPTDELLAQLADWTADSPVTGVYWLAALDDEGDLGGYELATWREALRRRVKALYATMRHLWDSDAFLVSATRLGGYHGYGPRGAASALGGAVTGFTKSYKKERPGALVKAVDLPVDRRTAAVADLLIEETLRDPGCVEVGRVDGRRFGIALMEQPFPSRDQDGDSLGEGGMALTSDSVVLVTGAAGSIVSAITADLAVHSGGVFHLLDLTPAPDPGDPDIAAFRSDRAALKGTIAARLRDAGAKPTPVAIDRELAHLERLEAALTCVESVEAAGGTAYYYSVDLTDPAAVAAVMDSVRERSGRIDVLLHAAGLEISRNLPEKEPREFDLVFDVKTTGWFNVWQAARELEVGAVVAFSSVAGRFGNQGQTDYSSANDLLCKVVASLPATRPQTRGLALDWTAWGGIGMATRGSIPTIMEQAGVEVLPPEAGVAWIRRELMSSGFSGEVVVAGALGMMATEHHESGGLDVDVLRRQHPFGPMVGDVTLSVNDGVVSRVTLDPAAQGFLTDHRIDGTPVLPGVMGMEAFAEVAALVAPAGHRVGAVEDVSFLAPVKFYRDEPRTLTVHAVTTPDPEGGDDLVAHCILTAERRLPGSDEPLVTTHFTGRVRLTGAAVEEEHSELDRTPHDPQVGAEQVYRFYFHGPAYQVVESAWLDGNGPMARLHEPLPDDRSPADSPLTLAPRLVELCFQTAGLWDAAREDRLGLPMTVRRVSVLLDPATLTGRLVAHAESHDGQVDAVVVDEQGRVVVRLEGYVTVPLPGGLPDDVRAPLEAAFGAGTPA